MPREKAPWEEKITAARRAAFEALAPDERAAFEAARAATQERGRMRRITRADRLRRINEAVLRGLHPAEIAAEIGIKVTTVKSMRKNYGVALSTRKGWRRCVIWLRESEVEVLDKVAQGRLLDREVAAAQIVRASLEEDGRMARRMTKQGRA